MLYLAFLLFILNFEVQNYSFYAVPQRFFAIIFFARFAQTPKPFEAQTDTPIIFLQKKSKVCPLC